MINLDQQEIKAFEEKIAKCEHYYEACECEGLACECAELKAKIECYRDSIKMIKRRATNEC